MNERKMEFRQGAAVFSNEFKGFFQYPRVMMVAPYLLLGIFCVIWLGRFVHFFVLLTLTLGCAIEPQLNNIFYRSSAEMEALTLLPVQWKTIVLAKNLASIALSIAFALLLTVILAYASPFAFGLDSLRDVVLCLSTAIFPLLAIGNVRSLKSPRPESGWTYRDLNESLWMIGIVVIVTAPYQLFVKWDLNIAVVLTYALLTWAYWRFVSLPAAIAGAETFFTQSRDLL
jgi:hypothetical protein